MNKVMIVKVLCQEGTDLPYMFFSAKFMYFRTAWLNDHTTLESKLCLGDLCFSAVMHSPDCTSG